ncbi:uncharacterized protein LAJ45_09387 [Morchella importuna]|uniref:uncharacterized protein n=1 Tax=Morchella importuna TaxID=1174673 RepID=UPI001E8D2FAD|nr:uncharacterized protein LAJ45_09387 [Morchella importuna]KAH8146704.1 hypothetical protein LAJ45_09387 [Morchella importuna]
MSASTYVKDYPEHVHDPSKTHHHLHGRVHSKVLHDAKVRLIHFKNQLGKYKNLINPNHRHDEPHEQRVDEKRDSIRESHRFTSFADIREGNNVKWYIDGRDYFWAVSVALENAKEVIYIADWWLSPELFLRRPPQFNKEWRLDRILKRRAEEGVKIYVIVYKEVAAALTCNSAHTKSALEKLCPKGSPGHGNIVVMRHPDHSPFEHAADMTFYWAHHEKFIVIDHKVAFAGGLDLCFGRWDLKQHPLADVHPGGVANEVWPGQDFNNNRVLDFHNVQDWDQNQLDKKDYGRMPWHDVSLGIIGPCVYDIAEHFVGRWNFIKRDKYKRHPRYPWIELSFTQADLLGVVRPRFPVGGFVKHPLHPTADAIKPTERGNGTCKGQVVRSASDWSHGILKEDSIANAYKELIRGAQHYVYIENQFFITATGEEQAPIKNTIGAAIVDAVLRAAKEGRKFRVICVIPAIPGFPGDLRDAAAAGTRAIIDYQYKSICRGEHSIMSRIEAAGVDPKKYIFFFNLRSYDRLHKSKELEEKEAAAGIPYSEIQRAHAADVMGEEGVTGGRGWEDTSSESSVDEDAGAQYTSELRARKERFERSGKKAKNNLKEHDSIAADAMLNERQVSDEVWEGDEASERQNFVNEELYIHAKVMIVDDRAAIIGSANINDRSQLGSHDSEMSIVIEDTHTITSTMDGAEYPAARFAATLRRQLWREHLGLLPPETLDASNDPNAQPPSWGEDGSPPNEYDEGSKEDLFVRDPLGDEVWETWTGNALRNTEIFRELFHCDPDDNIKTWKDYDSFLPRGDNVKSGHLFVDEKMMSTKEVKAKLSQIRGHLVWMPLMFLQDEKLDEQGLSVNAWTESIYT